MPTDVDVIVAHLQTLAELYIFEPNDQDTRVHMKDEFEESLAVFKMGADHLRFAKRTYPDLRNIFDYSVVCDESNNPPDVIDRNELKIDVAIKPDHKADFTFSPITVRGVE